MHRTHVALISLVVASALVAACGGHSKSDDDDSRAATGGRSATEGLAGTASSTGGAVETGGEPGGAGGSFGGTGADSGGDRVSSGGSGGGATAGGSELGGTGGATGGGRITGGWPSGGALAGGPATVGGHGGGTTTGGRTAGGTAGLPVGGAPRGGAMLTGGVPTGGVAPAAGAGGTGGRERVLCGGIVCNEDEVCCGPVECGHCINEFTGPFCPDTCPGTGGAGGASNTCWSNDYALPDLDRSCTTASDCFVGVHWLDCCANAQAVAFNLGEGGPFRAYEALCSMPACACPSTSPRTQEGTAIQQITDAVAECVDGLCLARAPENVGTCLGTDFCISVEEEGACIDTTIPVSAGPCRGDAGICDFCVCAAPDTPIATPSGDRSIADLRVGDLVYSVEDEVVVVVPIAEVHRTRVDKHHVVEVLLESGVVLQVSPGHPTADGRTFADLLGGGQLDGQLILAARMIAYQHQYTYDVLPASSTGTYFAGGALIGSTLF